MLKLEHEKYGKVVIYEPEDIKGVADYPPEDIGERDQWAFEIVSRNISATASVVGFRDTKKRIVRVIKNRYAPLEDYETEQFILNYSVVEEIIDPIYSRFEILDL